MSYHACVWIDQQEAKIFEIGTDEASVHHAVDPRPHHHLHRKADHVGLGTVQMEPELLKEVAQAIKGAKAILIKGPGKAKTVLKTYLDEHFPEIAAKVWDVQPADHPTDREMVAAARSWFHAQDRMHR